MFARCLRENCQPETHLPETASLDPHSMASVQYLVCGGVSIDANKEWIKLMTAHTGGDIVLHEEWN